MSGTPYFSYASGAEFASYMAGAGRAGSFFGAAGSDDDAFIIRTLEAVSRRMEQRLNRVFGPRTETHSFDMGKGPGRSDRLLWEHHSPTWRMGSGWDSYGDYGGSGSYGDFGWSDAWSVLLGAGVITLLLDDWLLTPTTVTAYTDTARDPTTLTLTQGQGNDYLLLPYQESPKRVFRLTETTTARVGWGQQTLTILGEWGWPYTLTPNTTVKAAQTIASGDTTLSATNVTSIALLSPGQTLRFADAGAEQVYLYKQAAGVFSMYRGVNGTSASAHAAGVTINQTTYDSGLSDLCLEMARNRYRERDAGQTQTVGLNGVSYTRPGAEEEALLKRLSRYQAKAPPMMAF